MVFLRNAVKISARKRSGSRGSCGESCPGCKKVLCFWKARIVLADASLGLGVRGSGSGVRRSLWPVPSARSVRGVLWAWISGSGSGLGAGPDLWVSGSGSDVLWWVVPGRLSSSGGSIAQLISELVSLGVVLYRATGHLLLDSTNCYSTRLNNCVVL